MPLFQFLWTKSSSERYIRSLRRQGMKIGCRTVIHSPRHCLIDTTRPFLIEIGDDVQITWGVAVLTHGYEWSVLKHRYGEILGSCGRVKIGNNVFIGMNSVILKGVTIGDHVIIGANSLVNRDIPANCVYAGNPAKFIMTTEEYHEKRKQAQIGEAKELALAYYGRFGKIPPKALFAEFFWLFENRKTPLPEPFERMITLTGNREESIRRFRESVPAFNDYEDFLKFCGIKNDGVGIGGERNDS